MAVGISNAILCTQRSVYVILLHGTNDIGWKQSMKQNTIQSICFKFTTKTQLIINYLKIHSKSQRDSVNNNSQAHTKYVLHYGEEKRMGQGKMLSFNIATTKEERERV